MAKRTRRVGSLADELVKKAKEAMLTAVQIFNNPHIEFKAELFIVTSSIAWTYLMHAYFRKHRIEYRQFEQRGKKRFFKKTAYGAYWNWSLNECLGHPTCPVDEIVKKNLRFLIGIRNEIEHQMTTRIDDSLSAKFQASAMNFNTCIKDQFGAKHSLDAEQAFSIQFSGISEDTARELLAHSDLPQHIRSFVSEFENGLTPEEYNDQRFSYRVFFARKTSNTKTGADKAIEFLPADMATELNNVYLRETEKKKHLPGMVVHLMQDEGFAWFTIKKHTDLWKQRDAKNPKYQFGASVAGTWYWYDSWIGEVRTYCSAQATETLKQREQEQVASQQS
jgi:hypothetical protein